MCVSRRTSFVAFLALLTLGAVPAAASGTATGTPESAAITCKGHLATIVGTRGADRIKGTPGPDVIAGRQGRDRIRSGGGADVVCAGPGWDHVYSGPGSDRLHGNGGRDIVSGGAGADKVYGDEPSLGGATNTLRGGRGDDQLYGDPSNQDDTVSYAGRSTGIRLHGRVVRIGQETDHLHNVWSVEGSAHADVLRGTERNDELIGLGGDDRIIGMAGPDSIDTEWKLGGGGDDTIIAGKGSDWIDATRGNDRVRAGRGDDTIGGPRGSDRYRGGPGTDTLSGFTLSLRTATSLTIRISAGRMECDGRTRFRSFERYVGGARSDRIIGTPGPDRISGSDLFDNGVRHDGHRRRAGDATVRRKATDHVAGRGGDDVLRADGVVLGGAGDDDVEAFGTARGGPGDDRVDASTWDGKRGRGYGGAGDDRLRNNEIPLDPLPPGKATVMRGGGGDDIVEIIGYELTRLAGLYGGAGHDLVMFDNTGPPRDERTIDLSSGTASQGRRTIDLAGFEDVNGGVTVDTIIGDDADNVLRGGKGVDSADGRGGSDTCVAESVTNCED